MAYLIAADYNRLIQDVSLSQIISGNAYLKGHAEAAALTEIKSYLRAKYDVDTEFTDTTLYSNIATYKAANRVYIDASAYSASATYALGSLVLQAGNIYRCTIAITVAEAFTIGKWELLGVQYDIFYCSYPKPIFNINGIYKKDDQVFWKDKIYTCIIPTGSIDHQSLIQYNSTKEIPYTNVFPDDASYGAASWGNGTTYTVPAGSILDTTYFTKGDNRNQQLVLYTLDVAIYQLYCRIPPQVVPEERRNRYFAVKDWCKSVSKGNDVIADIVKLQPPQGNRIRYGSRPKQDNYY